MAPQGPQCAPRSRASSKLTEKPDGTAHGAPAPGFLGRGWTDVVFDTLSGVQRGRPMQPTDSLENEPCLGLAAAAGNGHHAGE